MASSQRAVRPIRWPRGFAAPHNNITDNLAFLDCTTGNCFLNTQDDNFAQPSKPLPRATKYLDAPHDFRTAVISYIQHCLHLDHRNIPYSIFEPPTQQSRRRQAINAEKEP